MCFFVWPIALCRTLSSGSWSFFPMSKVLVPRLWSKKDVVAREKVAKLVNDTYKGVLALAMDFLRRMQASGASDLASKGQVSSESERKEGSGGIRTEAVSSFRRRRRTCEVRDGL